MTAISSSGKPNTYATTSQSDSAAAGLARFSRPYDWTAIDAAVRDAGGAIVENILPTALLHAINAVLDRHIQESREGFKPVGFSEDVPIGNKTTRICRLLELDPCMADLVGSEELKSWAERIIVCKGGQVILSTVEMIQIEPGETMGITHRDTDSWPDLPIVNVPIEVNAFIAFTDFTLENGATHIVPGSWKWPIDRKPNPEEFVRATMSAGDAVLFRGDLLHAGGKNSSDKFRRAISLCYIPGWLRPCDNFFLSVDKETTRKQSSSVRSLLGYVPYREIGNGLGFLGLNGAHDPSTALD